MKLIAITALGALFFYGYHKWKAAQMEMKGPKCGPIPEDFFDDSESLEAVLERIQRRPITLDELLAQKHILYTGDITLPREEV